MKNKNTFSGEEALSFLILEKNSLSDHKKYLKKEIKKLNKKFIDSDNKDIMLLSKIDDYEDILLETELMLKNNKKMYDDLSLAISKGHDINITIGSFEDI